VLDAAKALVKPLVTMEPTAPYGGPYFQALTLRPMNPLPRYAAEYDALLKYLRGLGLHLVR